MPTGFSMYDTRIVLSIDSERVSARELNGRLLFSFSTEDLRDVQLRKVWDPMFPLVGPTFVVGPTNSADTQSFEPLTVFEEDWNASYMLPSNYLVGLIGYFALGAIVAPFKIPTEILDLVWEEDGQPKPSLCRYQRMSLAVCYEFSARPFALIRVGVVATQEQVQLRGVRVDAQGREYEDK